MCSRRWMLFSMMSHPFQERKIFISKLKMETFAFSFTICFLLENASRAEGVGFGSLKEEFSPDYRDNDRTLFMFSKLEREVWKRLEPILAAEARVKDLAPFGFNVEGKWHPIGLNECFRFCRYNPGAPHIDANHVRHSEERSILTFMLYLNDSGVEFQGGITQFLEGDGKVSLAPDDPHVVIQEVTPEAGMAIIFNHDILHEGGIVSEGRKYICRSDIIFRREEPSQDESWQDDPNYILMVDLYRRAGLCEHQEKFDEATKCYEEALQLRIAQRVKERIKTKNQSSGQGNDG
eukprot:TRINITY_DN1489_c0_g1_i6.p1 TRINITY_DN1489_c0_g1~~TRINITY_DN1489_c0_g1_i6.p1  ORF type:complete len:292 (+),score=37.76 TRINITY_DN1489_c0_g1_i6:576-1451(+)